MWIGDFALGSTLDFKFTTRAFATGVPTTLAGTPAISAYPDNSTTQLTAGITLSVDFDSVTGLNNVRVVATSGNGYATATNYALVITTGTVGGTSVVGEVVGHFSIEARSSLRPTTAGRTLDVSATGEAGIDWGNVGSPTTTVGLSGTTIKDATDVETSIAAVQSDTNDIQTRLPAALAGGRMDASVGAYQTGLTPLQPTVAGRTLDVSAGGEAGVDWANVGSPTTVQGLSGTTIKAVTDGVTVATNNDKTGYSIGVGGIASTAFAANAIDSAALDASAGQDIADEFLSRDLQGGSSASDRNVTNAFRTLRNRVVIGVGGSVTVYQEDDTTPAWTGTATRDAAADPITEILPA